jgi:hypothetical protein
LREAISAMRSHGEEFRARAADRNGRKARHG